VYGPSLGLGIFARSYALGFAVSFQRAEDSPNLLEIPGPAGT